MAAGVFAAPGAVARACSCMVVEHPEAFEQAAAVFEGRVVSVHDDEPHIRTVLLRVARAWKGVNTEELEVTTARDSAACGFNFEVDASYLVYTHSSPSVSQSVSLCGRTTKVTGQSALADIAAMGEGITPASPQSPAEEVLPEEEEYAELRPQDRQPPAVQGGCASCSVAASHGPVPPGVLLVALVLVGCRLRRRLG